MKKPRFGRQPHQVVTRCLAPGQHNGIGEDGAERAKLGFNAWRPAFSDAECDQPVTDGATPFGAAKLEHGRARRIRSLEPVDQVIAAIIAERVKGHIVKRAVRYDDEPVLIHLGFERRKYRFVKLAQALIGHIFELPEVRVSILRAIAEFLKLKPERGKTFLDVML